MFATVPTDKDVLQRGSSAQPTCQEPQDLYSLPGQWSLPSVIAIDRLMHVQGPRTITPFICLSL
jgi:hypothetical protein